MSILDTLKNGGRRIHMDKVTEENPNGRQVIDSIFPFYDLEHKSLAILEELLDIVDHDERHGFRDSIMDLEDNLAIAMMLIQKYNDMSNIRNGYKRNTKDIHDEAEIKTHRRGGDFDYDRVLRVLTK